MVFPPRSAFLMSDVARLRPLMPRASFADCAPWRNFSTPHASVQALIIRDPSKVCFCVLSRSVRHDGKCVG